MKASLISCDWGLSTFRIRLLSGSDIPEILAELAEARGVASLATHESTEFSAALREGIEGLFQKAGVDPRPLPVYLSGMICSSLGWKQLPYAPLPFPLDGSRALVGQDILDCPWGTHSLTFISGVRGRDDAMRGEECEIVGYFAGDRLSEFPENAVVVLPGTHSKCVEVRKGEMAAFRTFLTGELYDLLCRHSVLRHSVGPDAAVVPDESFDMGVRQGAEFGLLGSLFAVRARVLLGEAGQEHSRPYLSGLLIGDEIAAVTRCYPAPLPFVLGGALTLQRLYRRGFELLGAGMRVLAVPQSISACAASLGHWHIFRERSVSVEQGGRR
jgi:2-dehydro-3-deoxygalactonokinase